MQKKALVTFLSLFSSMLSASVDTNFHYFKKNNFIEQEVNDFVFNGSFWIKPFLKYIKQYDHYEVDTSTSYHSGLKLGYNYKYLPRVTLGLSSGYSASKFRNKNKTADKIRNQSYKLSLYLKYDPKIFYIDNILSYSFNTYNKERLVNGNTAFSDYNGKQYGYKITLGKKIQKDNILLNPMLIGIYNLLKEDDYKEANASNKEICNASAAQSLILGIGGKIDYQYQKNIVPYIQGVIYKDFRIRSNVFLTDFTAGGTMFTTNIINKSKTTLAFNGGFVFLGENLEINTGVSLEIKTRYRAIGALIRGKYKI